MENTNHETWLVEGEEMVQLGRGTTRPTPLGIVGPPMLRTTDFRAVSNCDYRGHPGKASLFGNEVKDFNQLDHARQWLKMIRCGGVIEAWDPTRQGYVNVEDVEASR